MAETVADSDAALEETYSQIASKTDIQSPVPQRPYSLILSSWRSHAGAQKAIAHYRKGGLSPYFVKVDLGQQKTWWRIVMGCYQTRALAREAKRTHNLADAYIKKTSYANLMGVFNSEGEMADPGRRLEKQGYSPYHIEDAPNRLRLLVGAFHAEEGAARQNAKLLAQGFKGQVVER